MPDAMPSAGPYANAPKEAKPVGELSDAARAAMSHLEHNFLYRKLGIVFDYASRPGDFPSATLPKMREARAGQPNPAGVGTGMANCAANTCLLLDGYLTRLELGLAAPEEGRVTDRLVAGLIRLATAAQRGRLVRGLTPDGRGAYEAGSWHHLTCYAHALLRAHRTPAVSPESQTKLSDICGKWIARLRDEGFDLPALLPSPDADQSALRWERAVRVLHALAVAAAVHGDDEWHALFAERADDDQTRPGRPELPAECTDTQGLVSLQLAFADLASLDEGFGYFPHAPLLRRKIAYRMLPHLNDADEFALREPLDEAIFDWRKTLSAGTAPEPELWQRVYAAWPRLGREARTVQPAAQAALCAVLSADAAILDERAPGLLALLGRIPWDELWDATAPVTMVLAHALGHEQGLWDEPRPLACTPDRLMGNDYPTLFAPDHTPEPEGTPRPAAQRRRRYLPDRLDELAAGLDGPKQTEKSASKRGGGGRSSSGDKGGPSQGAKNGSEDQAQPRSSRSGKRSGARRGRNRRSRKNRRQGPQDSRRDGGSNGRPSRGSSNGPPSGSSPRGEA